MRTIKRTMQFKRDYKREKAGRHRAILDGGLVAVVNLLVTDTPLPERHRDHPLTGDWKDHRDCHIKPDLVLSTGSRMRARWNWYAWVRIVNLACDLTGRTVPTTKEL